MRIWAAPGSNAELPSRAWAWKTVFAFGWIPARYTQNKQDEASRLRPVLHPENHRQASGSKEVRRYILREIELRISWHGHRSAQGKDEAKTAEYGAGGKKAEGPAFLGRNGQSCADGIDRK